MPSYLRVATVLALLGIIGCTSYIILDRTLPDRLNPFALISINEKPSFLTRFKIAALRADEQACLKVLANSDLKYQLIENKETAEGCGFFGAVQLQQSDISYGGDIKLKCPALVGLAIWEKHDLQPLAAKILEQEVVRIRHYGTYSCRNINTNRSSKRRSQHATANAIDIAGFRLKDGTEISVLNYWGKNTILSDFLDALHQAACNRFGTVLGPDYNALHKDHFHFDQGSFGVCR